MQKNPVSENLEKIAKEFEKAGATKWDCAKIIKELQNEKLAGKKLKKKAADLLKEINPKAAEVYLSFQKMRVYTSSEKLEAFNRGNITKSLLKETKIGPAIAEKISSEVEDQLKSMNTRVFTTAMIRDMAATKLIEFDQAKTYFQYARLGLPLFDVQEKIGSKQYVPKEIARQFSWLKAVPQKAKEMHFKGKIEIIGPEDFYIRPFATCIAPKTEKQKTLQAVLELQADFLKNIENSTQSPSITALNTGLAKSLEKKTKTGMSQTVRFFAEQLDILYSIKKNIFPPSVGISLFTDDQELLSRKQKEKAAEFGTEFLRTVKAKKPKNFFTAIAISSKYELKLLKDLKEPLFVVNSFNGNNISFTENISSKKTGISQAAAINFDRLYEKKDDFAGEKIFQACRAVQEAFNEKEEYTKIQGNENFVFLNGFSGFLDKKMRDAEETIAEIRKCFKENTVLLENKKSPKDTMTDILLGNGVQTIPVAKNMEEVEELFSKKARFCILENL